jgi:hypothetical protein
MRQEGGGSLDSEKNRYPGGGSVSAAGASWECASSASKKHLTFAGTNRRAGSRVCTLSGSQAGSIRMRRSTDESA